MSVRYCARRNSPIGHGFLASVAVAFLGACSSSQSSPSASSSPSPTPSSAQTTTASATSAASATPALSPTPTSSGIAAAGSCSADAACGWDNYCSAHECTLGGVRSGACDKSLPLPGDCRCLAHECAIVGEAKALSCKTDADCNWDDPCVPRVCEAAPLPTHGCKLTRTPPGDCRCLEGICATLTKPVH